MAAVKKYIYFILLAFLIAAAAPKPVTWTAIGDSITYLNDHKDETGNRVTKGYLTLVTEQLPDIQYINKGYNGWTAQGIAREIEKLGLSSSDIYTIFLGTNDWWQGVPLGTLNDYKNNTGTATFFGSYRHIIDKLRSLNDKARIILITPMQRVDFVYIANMKNNAYGSYKEKKGQWLKQFADAINIIGTHEKLAVVDLYNKSGMTPETLVKFKRLKDPATGTYKDYTYPSFIDVPFNPEADTYPYPPESIDMTYDGLHPSDKGYAVITNMLLPLMKQ
jgi:lysophospholipase L1-like esterase